MDIRKIILLLFILIVFNCISNDNSYRNVTSSEKDINFYKLTGVKFKDDISQGKIYIPRFLTKNHPERKNNIFNYSYFEDNFGYLISIENLESRNTQKLNDKEYIDITYNGFKNQYNGDFSEIEKLLSPIMQNVRIIELKGNLIINDKYFLKRVAYFQDKTLEGTILEGVNCTNFHFVTIHNKRKYSFNINYYGDDKSISELIGLFNTIAGSISFY